MIDIHCHILPDFDDGAADLEESLQMAWMAACSGVTDIAVTPHFRGEAEFLTNWSVIKQRFGILQAAIAHEQIPLSVHLGAEVLCLPETPELAARRVLPALAGTTYLLTEFYFNETFAYMDEMLQEITAAGYSPVVAHPERYAAIQREPRSLEKWFRQGYVLQVNKGSILGSFGARAEQAAHWIMDAGLAHIVASDAHSSQSRTPHMTAIREWLAARCGDSYAQVLLEENPRLLLQGKPMTPAK